MKRAFPLLALASALSAIPGYAKKPLQLAGVVCQTPPPSHCPDANCPGPLVIEQGTAVEPITGRKFFLDYPCNLKRGEKITLSPAGAARRRLHLRVADVVRMSKGHTEGLEPQVTEELVKLRLSPKKHRPSVSI